MKELDPTIIKQFRGIPLEFKKSKNILVKHRIPNCFESFGLIFHPYYETDDLPPNIFKEPLEAFQIKREAYEKILTVYGFSEFEIPYVDNSEKLQKAINSLIIKKFGITEHQLNSKDNYPDVLKEKEEQLWDIMKESMMKGFKIFDIDEKQSNAKIKWKEIKWKELAERYNLIYHVQLNPRTFRKLFEIIGQPINLKYPKMDYMPKNIFNRVLISIKNFYNDKELIIVKDQTVAYQVEVNNIPSVLEGRITTIASLNPLKYIFHCGHDGVRTVFGGSVEFGEFLKETELEIMPCYDDTQLSWPDADQLNLFG